MLESDTAATDRETSLQKPPDRVILQLPKRYPFQTALVVSAIVLVSSIWFGIHSDFVLISLVWVTIIGLTGTVVTASKRSRSKRQHGDGKKGRPPSTQAITDEQDLESPADTGSTMMAPAHWSETVLGLAVLSLPILALIVWWFYSLFWAVLFAIIGFVGVGLASAWFDKQLKGDATAFDSGSPSEQVLEEGTKKGWGWLNWFAMLGLINLVVALLTGQGIVEHHRDRFNARQRLAENWSGRERMLPRTRNDRLANRQRIVSGQLSQTADQRLAEPTGAAWNTFVRDRHQPRFGIHRVADQTATLMIQSTLDSYDQFSRQTIQDVSGEDIDRDLYLMVIRHQQRESQMLSNIRKLLAQAQAEAKANGRSVRDVTAAEAMENGKAGLELLSQRVDELPAQVQRTVRQFLADAEWVEVSQYDEILNMQETLQSRYPSQSFTLPEVD